MVDEQHDGPAEDLHLEPVATVTTRRRALWGLLAVVAVAAASLAVTSGGGDGPPTLPVALGAATGREAAGAATTSADMSLAWVTYVAGEGLPTLGGDAPAYRLDGAVDVARVRALADALGLAGEPSHQSGVWHLESDGAVLEVYDDGGGAWWYSAQAYAEADASSSSGGGSVSSSGSACEPGPAVDCAMAEGDAAGPATTVPADACSADGTTCSTGSAVACPDGARCVEPCPPDAPCAPPPIEPVQPTDLPSKEEARGIAVDLLAATGMDLGDAKTTVDGPYDAWYVTVEPTLDGVPVTGWLASVGVGSKGAITGASGTLATPERVGTYPLIDTGAAIDRLNAMQGGFDGGPVPMGARDGVATDDVAVGTAEGSVPATSCRSDEPDCTTLVAPVAPTTSVFQQCTVQPDGSEVCQGAGAADPAVACAAPPAEPGTEPGAPTVAGCPDVGVCYDTVPPAPAGGAPETTLVSPGCTEPVPYPEPAPIEVTLTDAERVLVLLPSVDGRGASYLVPGYRFSNADGAVVEVAAVADESLAPTTTVPETTATSGGIVPPPTTPPGTSDPVELEPGQTPALGVGYYVGEVNTHCGSFVWADRWWATDSPTPLPWSTPTEGGTFTLSSPDEGTFVGDAAGTKVATFTARGAAADIPACA